MPSHNRPFSHSSTQTEVTGIVLAGGLSSRLGHDKALICLKNGEAVDLLNKTAELLSKVTGKVLIIGREASGAFPCIKDIEPGNGPVGGIATALEATQGKACFVLSCDLPFMEQAVLCRLLDERNKRPNGTLMTAYRQADTRHIEGLVSIFEPEALPYFMTHLAEKKLKITKVIPDTHQHLIDYSSDESLPFFNINYPADLEIARRLFSMVGK